MPNEQGIGSADLMQHSRVYHGTSEVESVDGYWQRISCRVSTVCCTPTQSRSL